MSTQLEQARLLGEVSGKLDLVIRNQESQAETLGLLASRVTEIERAKAVSNAWYIGAASAVSAIVSAVFALFTSFGDKLIR